MTTASLGEDIKDETSRSTIKLTYLKPQNDDSDDSDEEEKKEDEEQPIATTVLCSLTPGKVRIVITPGNKHENNACLLD